MQYVSVHYKKGYDVNKHMCTILGLHILRISLHKPSLWSIELPVDLRLMTGGVSSIGTLTCL